MADPYEKLKAAAAGWADASTAMVAVSFQAKRGNVDDATARAAMKAYDDALEEVRDADREMRNRLFQAGGADGVQTGMATLETEDPELFKCVKAALATE